MAESLQPSPPTGWMMTMSKLLRKPKDILNAPGKIRGTGLGDVLIGEAPEAWEDYAYGKSLNVGGPTLQTARLDPRIIDVATAPLLGAGGVAGAVKLGRRALTAQKATADILRKSYSAVPEIKPNPSMDTALTIVDQKYPGYAPEALSKSVELPPRSVGTTAILDPLKHKQMFGSYLDWAATHQDELEKYLVTKELPKDAPPGLRNFASIRELESGPLKELAIRAEKQLPPEGFSPPAPSATPAPPAKAGLIAALTPTAATLRKKAAAMAPQNPKFPEEERPPQRPPILEDSEDY